MVGVQRQLLVLTLALPAVLAFRRQRLTETEQHEQEQQGWEQQQEQEQQRRWWWRRQQQQQQQQEREQKEPQPPLVGLGLLPECMESLKSPEGLDGAFCTLFPAGRVPGENSQPAREVDVETSTVLENGVNDLTDVEVPTLLPYLVPGSDRAILVVPGGGYHHLAWNAEGTDVAAWLKSIGVSAFILKYRVPGRSWLKFGEAPRIDAQRAMRLLRFSAGSLGIDPGKIGMMGFSAGGHLTAETSTGYEQNSYRRIDLADDVSSRPDLAFLLYPWKLINRINWVQMKVDKNTPPSFLVHTEDDVVARSTNSDKYYGKLKRNGVTTSELHKFKSSNIQYGHGYGNCVTPRPKPPISAVCLWPTEAKVFMDKHWG